MNKMTMMDGIDKDSLSMVKRSKICMCFSSDDDDDFYDSDDCVPVMILTRALFMVKR